MKKTLSIRTGEAARAAPGNWGVGGERLERLKARAREERRSLSDAERMLWEQLAGAKIGGLKFSRKALVGSVLVDFACPSRWVVVNVSREGANAEFDALQDRKLADTGIRVLRFAEAEVLEGIGKVTDAIKAEVNKPFDRKAAMRQAARPTAAAMERSEG